MNTLAAVDVHLYRLKELTSELIDDFNPLMFELGDNFIDMTCEDGLRMVAYGLMKNDKVSVAYGLSTKGAELKEHTNPELEMLIVFSGEMTVNYRNKDTVLKTGNFILFCPGEPHTVKFTGDCEYIAITIPGSEYYPEGITNEQFDKGR